MASQSADKAAGSTLVAPHPHLDLPALEHEILAHWKANDIEARSLRGEGADPDREFVFYDGPPFATGLPHYGHLLAGTLKDIVPRYWAMRGYRVDRRFGWDCHGLPIESIVEERLSVHGRAEIESYGIDRFNAACRSGVLEFTAEWERVVHRMGRWVDFRNDYKTMDLSFMESVWWVFRQLWDKELIYEGHRVQPVSPALGTPLSNFEVALGPMEKDPVTRKDGYKRRQDPSITVRFELEDEPGATLWAWTTTPWTLPSNLALAVHPEVEYVKVQVVATGEIAYLQPALLAQYQQRGKVGETRELARMPGAALADRPYRPLFPYFAEFATPAEGRKRAFRVVTAEYVTIDTGTGIVHQAPAFGEDDFQTGKREGLPLVNPVDLSGRFSGQVGPLAGMFVKDADREIIQMLKLQGSLVDQDVLVHPYPHCYRTEQPLLYMAISTWFMKVETMRDALVHNNEQVRWVPAHVGSGRFGNWLASARDWNLSRNRFWGTPLPLWRCDLDPTDIVCVGSLEELEQRCGLERGSVQDLHRESIDALTFPSDKTPGGVMRRIPEVFDCWFESGSMPFAQNHYPFEASKRDYVERNLPADFIAEGLDQTRGWFYTLHVLSTALFDRPAFRNVIVNGLILAADGKKMSKRLKNYPDPGDILERYGADALRSYLIDSAVVRAEPMRFGKHAEDTSGEAVRDTVRTVILPLWNAYNFLAMYANADGWSPDATTMQHAPSHVLDRWILSRTTTWLAEISAEYESYQLYNLIPSFVRLTDDLNNWYIRRGRRRYWRSGADPESAADKSAAYATLYRVLVTLTRAMAPVMPFVTEWLWQRLVRDPGLAQGVESVHLTRFPEGNSADIDAELEAHVAKVREIVALGLSLRETHRIGVRRPLARLTVASSDPAVRQAVERLRGDLEAELNVKSVELVEDDSALVSLSAKANFKTLGKRLGAKMKAVASEIEALDSKSLASIVAAKTLTVAGEELTLDDLILRREPLPGLSVASMGAVTLVLDLNLSEELAREGLAREVINRLQNLRKDADLSVEQRIVVRLAVGPVLAAALADPSIQAMIAGETLSHRLEVQPRAAAADAGEAAARSLGLAHQREDEVDGEALTLALESVADAS